MIKRKKGDLLFVYGLLRKGAPHALSSHLEHSAKHISKGEMIGKLYLINYYPGMVSTEDGGKVIGDIYRIDDEDLWMMLDNFEGIPAVDEYKLSREKAHAEDGKLYDCIVYEYNKSTDDLPLISSGDFLKYRSEMNL